MYTLDKKLMLSLALYILLTAVFCAVFGAVYEVFSHGVYSHFMTYAFIIPLVLGTLPFVIISLRLEMLQNYEEKENRIDRIRVPNIKFWVSGTIVLTVGCMLQGVLIIFGTTNRLMIVYQVSGVILLILGLIFSRSYSFDRNN